MVKEILRWVFDGLARTMQLPTKKILSLRDTIKTTLRSGHIETKAFESLIGKCQHATLGIPGGRSLLPPLYKALQAAKAQDKPGIQIHPRSAQHAALRNLRTFFHLLQDNPVNCQNLYQFITYTFASEY